MKSETIISAICSVTKKWEKQRKAELRNSRTRERRRTMGEGQVAFTEVAHLILPAAYKHASGNSDRPVHNRQLYYAARESFLEMTGKEIDANYFTQTLVRKYVNQHQPDWNLVADPRGNFTIPNSSNEVRIPCGTLQVDRYLEERLTKDCQAVDPYPVQWPSLEEHARFKAVLYIEKEGFEPLLDEAKIAERFDLAIIGCKGQSVAAARKLVDHVCRVNGGVPLFIVHDFDKSGFEIAECLTEISDWAVDNDRVAYQFENEINFVDFGLRLDDAKKYNLNSERVKKKVMIKSSYVTDEERAFLESGRRIELNAFTAPQFIEWLESKLVEQLGKKRLVPDDQTLAKAYQRATLIARINSAIEQLQKEFSDVDCEVEQLRRLVCDQMSKPVYDDGETTWDRALYQIAKQHDEERIGKQ
jgi:DNA topoisomerase VI subunit A